jgi:hypothetical protein
MLACADVRADNTSEQATSEKKSQRLPPSAYVSIRQRMLRVLTEVCGQGCPQV